MKILVIDDSDSIRFSFIMLLESLSIGSIDEAPGGEEGVQKLKRSFEEKAPYDLVLLDYHMPILSGPEVFKKIKEFTVAYKIENPPKVVITSTDDNRNNVMEMLQSGVDEFLYKPVLEEKLRSVIEFLFPEISLN